MLLFLIIIIIIIIIIKSMLLYTLIGHFRIEQARPRGQICILLCKRRKMQICLLNLDLVLLFLYKSKVTYRA